MDFRGQIKKPSSIGVVATLLLLAAFGVSYRRGTALTPPDAPEAVSDGATCGLIAAHRVRCVVLSGAPVDGVWRLVTDYPRFPELFRSTLFEFELAQHERLSDDHWRLVGAVSGLAQRWPFEVETTHQRTPERSVASWQQKSGVLATDRGSWTLQARGGETLITYEIEVAMRGVPAFIINNVLLDTLPGGIEQLAEVAAEGAR